MPDKVPIENMLIDREYLTQRQLDRAMYLGEGRPDNSIEEVLIELGYITERALLSYTTARDHTEVAPFDLPRADRKVVAVTKPSFAMRDRILPMRFEEECLMVTAAYSASPNMLAEMETLSGMEARAVLVREKGLKQALRKAYGNVSEHIHGENAYFSMTGPDAVPGGSVSELSFMERVESTPVVRMVNAVIEEAFHGNASDIYVESGKDNLVIRIRTSGDLVVHTTFKMEFHCPMITRLKLMTGTDIAERRLPQNGKYHYEWGEMSTNLRIPTLPPIYSEKVVLGLLGSDKDNSPMDIRHPGTEGGQRTVLEHILKAPRGMVLVTGPTGSGKTTTLHVVLNRVVKKKISIVTVEDPTEKAAEGITQVQTNSKAGPTSASVLCFILRQGPDMIMAGEMRDEEIVDIGVRTAITGHLVLSTPHINGRTSITLRPHNMGVPPHMAVASLSSAVVQRLVKLFCPSYRQSCVPDGRKRRIFAKRKKRIPDKLWKATGCPLCGGTGYTRGTAVYKIMDVDEQIRAMILDKEPLSPIREHQEQKGSMPLRDHVLRMATGEQTDMEEVGKMLYSVQQEVLIVQRERGVMITSVHMRRGEKRMGGSTLVELVYVVAMLGIPVVITMPSYRETQDKSAEQVTITNARLNYILEKAQQSMLDADVLKNSEKEEHRFDKDSNSVYWEDQINGGMYKAYYYGDTGESETGSGN